ncbi:hypothetical protein C5S53_09495 [Methanophagales archaeon]|nr:hypothetical protein C5S53_09495 [Methanophagales archaeon]
MLELIYYGLFLLLYGFGAWMFFNGLQDYTKSIASKPQPSASQVDIGNMKPGTVCTAKHPGDIGEIDRDGPSHDELGVTEIANVERVRIEQEHRSILEDVLQEVLTEQPTSFDAIYEKYSGNCTSRELKKRLDKPRVRNRVKSYLRDMENEGKLKRVMNVREYFYVVEEEENEEVVSESGHVGVFQANEPNEARV